jgi:hypothetical protein
MKRLILPLLLIAFFTAAATPGRAQVPPDRAREQADRAREEAERTAQLQKAKLERAYQAQLERARAAEGAATANLARAKRDLDRQVLRLQTARPARKEMLPYCGVSTVEVTPPLASQLKLAPGTGLLVDFVEPKSPAEMAGIRQYDILMKFNDQLLCNPEQLRVLVRSKTMSDDVKFSVIRQGQPTSVNVELGQKETEVEPEADAATGTGMSAALALRGARLLADADHVAPGGGAIALTDAGGHVVLKDAQSTLDLDLKEGKPFMLVARDRAGNEIYNGPVTTEDQRNALPPTIAQKLQQVRLDNPMLLARGAATAAAGPRVFTSTEKDTLMLARFDKGKPLHAFAFSTTDGKVLFDGPVATEAQRKAMPPDVARQLQDLEKNQNAAAEFGVIGRDGF